MSAARVGVLVADAITRWEFKLIILLNPIPEQYYVRFAQSFTRGLTIILMVIIILILQRIRKLISFPVKEGRGLLVGKCRLSPLTYIYVLVYLLGYVMEFEIENFEQFQFIVPRHCLG